MPTQITPVLCRFEITGQVADSRIVEASGLVASRRHPERLYTHNDSGEPRLFALNAGGEVTHSWVIDGASFFDVEDIALSEWSPEEYSLILGDIGDNAARDGTGHRNFIEVMRISEPDEDDSSLSAATYRLTYPHEGLDAEALIAHGRSVYILTKEPTRSRVYRAELPETPTRASVMMNLVTELPIGSADYPGLFVTSADYLEETGLVLRTYTSVLFFSAASSAGQSPPSLEDLLTNAPEQWSTPRELQGEAIAIGGNGQTVWSLPEGARPSLSRRFIRCE